MGAVMRRTLFLCGLVISLAMLVGCGSTAAPTLVPSGAIEDLPTDVVDDPLDAPDLTDDPILDPTPAPSVADGPVEMICTHNPVLMSVGGALTFTIQGFGFVGTTRYLKFVGLPNTNVVTAESLDGIVVVTQAGPDLPHNVGGFSGVPVTIFMQDQDPHGIRPGNGQTAKPDTGLHVGSCTDYIEIAP